jgi:hypothetical protein
MGCCSSSVAEPPPAAFVGTWEGEGRKMYNNYKSILEVKCTLVVDPSGTCRMTKASYYNYSDKAASTKTVEMGFAGWHDDVDREANVSGRVSCFPTAFIIRRAMVKELKPSTCDSDPDPNALILNSEGIKYTLQRKQGFSDYGTSSSASLLTS